MEHHVWSAIGSAALRLGSETRRGSDCCWTGCGVTESTFDNTTSESMRRDATSELSLLMALAIEWCMSSRCMGFLVLETMPRECDKMNSCRGTLSNSCLGRSQCFSAFFLWPCDQPLMWGDGQTAQRRLQKRPPKSSHRHVLCTRDLEVESMQCLQIVSRSIHFVMSAWWRGGGEREGAPTYQRIVKPSDSQAAPTGKASRGSRQTASQPRSSRNVVHLWEKVRLSGTALLLDARVWALANGQWLTKFTKSGSTFFLQTRNIF